MALTPAPSLPSLAAFPDVTPNAVATAYADLVAALPDSSASLEAWLGFFVRWDALKRWVDGELSRRRYRERQDTRDEAAREAMRVAREEIGPLLESGEARVRVAFLEAGCRAELANHLGAQLFIRLAIAQSAYDPANVKLRVQEGQMATDYMRLMGDAELRVGDESLTIMQATARLTDPDGARRRAAWEALSAWMNAHADDLHQRYDRLIAVRHHMAQNLGERDFVALGYRRMGRSDYGPAEVAVFRDEIKHHVVPVMARLRAWQARELGSDLVMPWDAEYYPGVSLSAGIVPVGEQMARARTLFERLDPRLAAHFAKMEARGLIDLPSRPGKATGAFCTVFEDTGEVAIFGNSSGNVQDLITLTHEMGHAFQVSESLAIPAMDLRWPGMDAAEVLSMGLELLALKEIGAFLENPDVARYRRLLAITVLNRLPYMAVVDAFQHWVYENPTHTHGEREARWDALWHEFLPGVDYHGQGNGHRTRWMRQMHIFQIPFYYIDYALAQTGALQLWAKAEADHGAALEAFLALCRLGGTRALVDFFESAGLKSPFTPGLLGPLMANLVHELGI